MSVLELSEMVKELEEKFGVSAAAAAVAAAPAAGGAAGEAAAEENEFDVIPLPLRQEDQRHQGSPRHH